MVGRALGFHVQAAGNRVQDGARKSLWECGPDVLQQSRGPCSGAVCWDGGGGRGHAALGLTRSALLGGVRYWVSGSGVGSYLGSGLEVLLERGPGE